MINDVKTTRFTVIRRYSPSDEEEDFWEENQELFDVQEPTKNNFTIDLNNTRNTADKNDDQLDIVASITITNIHIADTATENNDKKKDEEKG